MLHIKQAEVSGLCIWSIERHTAPETPSIMKSKTNGMPSALTRRNFLRTSSLAISGAACGGPVLFSAESPGREGRKYRAAIIGHTGRGDYGHGLDVLFNDYANIQVVAVADPNAAGRAKTAEKCKALRQYDDYRVMLEKEKPQLVSIAPRWTDQHHAMAMAALKVGAHIFMEKPIMQTLAEADEVLAA